MTGRDWRGSGTVLLVDDEESIRATNKEMLELLGFRVLTAPDGRQALKVFGDHAAEIVCVLLDLRMPHMDGEQTFGELRRLRPGVKILLCSGQYDYNVLRRLEGKGLDGFLSKPFLMSALRAKLIDILGEATSAT